MGKIRTNMWIKFWVLIFLFFFSGSCAQPLSNKFYFNPTGELAWVGCEAVTVSDKLQLKGDTWHVTCDTGHITHIFKKILFFLLFVLFCQFWYLCYYPRTSRDFVSPVSGIFGNILVSSLFCPNLPTEQIEGNPPAYT